MYFLPVSDPENANNPLKKYFKVAFLQIRMPLIPTGYGCDTMQKDISPLTVTAKATTGSVIANGFKCDLELMFAGPQQPVTGMYDIRPSGKVCVTINNHKVTTT